MVSKKPPEWKKPDSREVHFQRQCDFSKIIGLPKLYLAKFYAIVNSSSLKSFMILQIFVFFISFVTRLRKQPDSLWYTDVLWSELYLALGISLAALSPSPPSPQSPTGQPWAPCSSNANSMSLNTSCGFSSLYLCTSCIPWDAFKTHTCMHTQ